MQKGRISVFFKVSRAVVPLLLPGLLAGCNSSSSLSEAAPRAQAGTSVVVQAICPQIYLRDSTASHREYLKGGKDDPEKLVYQASFADTTRSCTTNGDQITISVMAQGRVVAGAAGKAGTVSLPVRVEVTETSMQQVEQSIYAQNLRYPAEIPADSLSAQFLFSKTDVVIPASAAQNAKVYIGFDAGPLPKEKKRK